MTSYSGSSSLTSVKVTVPQPSCLQCYLYMYGSQLGHLILSRDDVTSSKSNDLWIESGDKGPFWYPMLANLEPGTFYIRFTYQDFTYSNLVQTVALDDIIFTPGKCKIGRWLNDYHYVTWIALLCYYDDSWVADVCNPTLWF